MTLIQGAGVHCAAPRMVTYSRPAEAKPPRPLKNSRSGRASRVGGTTFPTAGRLNRETEGSGASRRRTWSKRLPRWLNSTTRATLCSRLRAPTDTSSIRRTNTPPRAEVEQLDLRLCPCQCAGTLERGGVVMLVGQVEHLAA
jgi:hypothetical protein